MVAIGAAIIRKDNQILICQRGAGGSCAFLWEFPGGKAEPGEDLQACVIRECREELNIEITVKDVFGQAEYRYPEIDVMLTFFNAQMVGGSIRVNVHENVRWVRAEDLVQYQFCPADIEIVERLKIEQYN